MEYMVWGFLLDELADHSDGASYRKLTCGVMDILRSVTSIGFLIAPIARHIHIRDPLKDRPVILTDIESLTAE